ncbi:tRNA (cytidine(34)-2'-O)-methyltransferase [bacterium]|nr:tRNA (cytidine(34)-2'-O)-methyltransferase [bacterium]
MTKINVALYEPEIPQNTGNIARLCACCGADLYLVGKLGFALTDKYTKRAGLDYWDSVNIKRVNSIEELQEQYPNSTFYYLTTKSKKLYTNVQYKEGDFIVFGPESRGLPQEYVTQDTAVTIPMKEGQRSLNLSNSVAITVYEAIRQNGI